MEAETVPASRRVRDHDFVPMSGTSLAASVYLRAGVLPLRLEIVQCDYDVYRDLADKYDEARGHRNAE